MFFSSESQRHRLGALSLEKLGLDVFKVASSVVLCLGFASPAFALDFTPLKGGYNTGGELKLQSQVRQLPVGSESQLRSTCLRASIKNSAPASQYSSDTEPVPMLVDFDATGRAAGVVNLKTLRSVSDPVSIVTLRSDCPLAVFEVSWTVFLTPPGELSGGKEPRWDMDNSAKVVAANDTELREFSLKDSRLLDKSRKPATGMPVPGTPSSETRTQMLRLKNELQKTNTVAEPEKMATEKVAAEKVAAEKVAAEKNSIGNVSALQPTNIPGAVASLSPSAGHLSGQNGLVVGESITPSPSVQEVAIAPLTPTDSVAPLDDLDRLNKNLASQEPITVSDSGHPDWITYVFAASVLILMLFGAFWSYQRFGSQSLVMPGHLFRRSHQNKSEFDLMQEPTLFDATTFSADFAQEDDEQNDNTAPAVEKVSRKKAGVNSRKQKSQEEPPQEHLQETSQKKVFDYDEDTPVVEPAVLDSGRLFESMLGADGHAQDTVMENEDRKVTTYDGRHREGLEVTLHALDRTAVKPWKLPVAYASLIAARNRSLSFELPSQVLRCEVGLLELAFQETRRGRLLDQSAINELVSIFIPHSDGYQNDVQPTIVPDILQNHLKTKRYELNGVEAQNRFKANCLQLSALCQVWPFCFSLPEWAHLVEDDGL